MLPERPGADGYPLIPGPAEQLEGKPRALSLCTCKYDWIEVGRSRLGLTWLSDCDVLLDWGCGVYLVIGGKLVRRLVADWTVRREEGGLQETGVRSRGRKSRLVVFSLFCSSYAGWLHLILVSPRLALPS